MAGVTLTGFERPTFQEILDGWQTRQLAEVDPNLDVSPDQPLGQINGILAESLAGAWETLEDVYHAFDPDAAEGVALTALATLTGTDRRGDDFSHAACVCRLNAGATVPQGSLISVAGRDDIVFLLDSDISNGGGAPADVPASFTSINSGPVSANAGQLTHIVTPISGWVSVTNPLDAVLGRFVDSDITLRQRRKEQLALRGGSTLDGIVGDLLQLETIDDVIIIENELDHVDFTTGLPAHSFEALIADGNATPNDTVSQTIWDSKPGGIRSFGNTTGIAIDRQGRQQPVRFSRAIDKLVYISVDISFNSRFSADTGEQAVIDAILTRCRATFGVGDDVVPLVPQSAPLAVPGVTNVVIRIGLAVSPVNALPIAISLHEIARFDSSRIAVNFP